jgi:hypothetical protein
MRFHGFMLVRDEEDIVPQSLDKLLAWCDCVYIYDLGSTDSTWDIVQDYASKDKRIVPFMRRPTIFGEGLRGFLFDRYRERFDQGDWVVKLDVDEFHDVSPRDFVAQRLRPFESRVDLMWYYFRLTNRDVAAYKSDADILADRLRPIELRRRFYKIVSYSEPRMFRYRKTMRWAPNDAGPFNMGILARARLPIRHYPHRDPLQMERRYRLRAGILRLGGQAYAHWKLEDWRKDVVDMDSGSSNFGERTVNEGLSSEVGHTDGQLREWIPGTALPQVNFQNHLEPLHKRLMKRVMYRTVVPWMDSRRPSYPRDYEPKYIDESVNRGLCSPGT